HQYNPQSVIISKKFWDTLSADEKKIIADAAVEAGKFQRQTAREAAGTALDALKKAGMQVTELSAPEMSKLRDKMRPVIAKYAVSVGQETVKAMQAELEKVRK
ncbi:MAG: TRAP transporter substrate-binding protein, partial [Pseudomonadota bacterium]